MRRDRHSQPKGFTLIELLVAIAILAIIAAVAMPMYQGYVQTSRDGVLANNISSIEIFQEDFRLRTGNYLLAAADVAAIQAAIGWTPQGAPGATYSIADGGGGSYNVTGTDVVGTTVCIQFPAKVRC